MGVVLIACKTKKWSLGLEFKLEESFKMCRGARGPQSWFAVCCVTLLKNITSLGLNCSFIKG